MRRTFDSPIQHIGSGVSSVFTPSSTRRFASMSPRYATVFVYTSARSATASPTTKRRTVLRMPSAPSTTSAACVVPSAKWSVYLCLCSSAPSAIEVQRLSKCACARAVSSVSMSPSRSAALDRKWKTDAGQALLVSMGCNKARLYRWIPSPRSLSFVGYWVSHSRECVHTSRGSTLWGYAQCRRSHSPRCHK